MRTTDITIAFLMFVLHNALLEDKARDISHSAA